MARAGRVNIGFISAVRMIASYATTRLAEQLRAVALVVVYLVAFQLIVFQGTPGAALAMAGRTLLVVVGLTLLLEGLLLGLMPLGQRVGVRLSARTGLAGVIVFGLVIGVGSTLAEPAIAALRIAGGTLTAWESPLLYYLLERTPQITILVVGVGVGIATVLGVIRIFVGFSLKPLIIVAVLAALALTVVASRSESLHEVVGLAWDAGAITTGPVTVPLVLALGLGVSRAAGGRRTEGGGFGIVALASALPVTAIIVLALLVAPRLPGRTDERSFFSAERRDETMRLFEDDDALRAYAFTAGTETSRRAVYESESDYLDALDSLAGDPAARSALLGSMTLEQWLSGRASEAERARVVAAHGSVGTTAEAGAWPVFRRELLAAVRAIVPLVAILVVVLVVLLRDRPRYLDEVVLGIVLAVAGMTLLTVGIRLGLAPLGDVVGRRLPEMLSDAPSEQERVIVRRLDPSLLLESIDPDGQRRSYFYLERDGAPELVEFDPARFNAESGLYTHVVEQERRFYTGIPLFGIGLIMIFAFGMGFGSTLAEPALNALGRTVEDITVGTMRRRPVIRAVSIGVGLGLMAGVARILFDLPLLWLLLIPYLPLLILSLFSSELVVGLSWDSGGVTTGPVTVPLVLSMGLGIGNAVGAAEGFGILAMASLYPIAALQVFGFAGAIRERRAVRAAERGVANE